MSQISVDHNQARKTLSSAIKVGKAPEYSPKHPKKGDIADVMLGRHLTYRYILFTNLLAKATQKKANGLSLQAGANLVGSFDSRSLCHNVVVDFDRDPSQLAGKLGRSNEPYLNKPARYPALTTDNAVRRGYDRSILEKCIDILGGLKDEVDARTALEDAVYYTLKRQSLVAEAAELDGDALLYRVLVKFASLVTSQSNEGESCAIVTGLGFYLFGQGLGRNYDVRVHPVNQAGSSSKEILDVDIYLCKNLEYAAEVKDKKFSANDVGHAASKAKAAGLASFFFICGPQSGGATSGSEFINGVADIGVKVSFVDIEQFFATALGFATSNLDSEEVWEFIDHSMNTARVKDGTRNHVIDCAKKSGLVS